MNIVRKVSKYIAIVTIMSLPVAAFAQGPGFDDDVEDVPVDGGVSLLVAAGVGYGAKKLKDARKKRKEEASK